MSKKRHRRSKKKNQLTIIENKNINNSTKLNNPKSKDITKEKLKDNLNNPKQIKDIPKKEIKLVTFQKIIENNHLSNQNNESTKEKKISPSIIKDEPKPKEKELTSLEENNKQLNTFKNNSISKPYLIIIIICSIILLSLITGLTILTLNYYQLINENNYLLQEITETNSTINNITNETEKNNNLITEKENTLKDKIEEYNIWVETKNKIEKALS